MKSALALLAFIFIVSAIYFSAEAKVVACEPYLMIRRNCDLCDCNADGSFLNCRPIACSPDAVIPVGTAMGQADTICRAGGVFQAECNSCRCSQLGNDISCTKKLCV